ncbi:porin [Actimicrobium sp. CCI2.3]|uniref:porin n=1 Tax=Actimicrobium sp. CCI2.3 TaxID=3048616 RepID=UPI002AB502D0|nr:porin [Actimicrobium sp. CCI2.3]MDY7573998.1 porin [Actimicrobium sp. CCI2.3]MEB0021894.1 porin [Actimicrobium sp. CCI2.3]
MKKSLLVLAIFGAFAGVASAQTSITTYGIVDMGITREMGGAAGNVTKLANGVQSGSRLGFKGTEDLGSGLKAMFQLETGINADTGGFSQGGLAFGRQAYVGLNGGFGTASMGRQYNPLFTALDEVDPFGTGLAGSSTNLFITGATRVNNSLKYVAPAMGGITAEAIYGFGEVAGNSSASRTIGGSVGYSNGPIISKLVYERVANATNTSTTKFTQGTFSYNFNVAVLAVGYGKTKDDTTINADSAMVGVTVPFGASAVMASYIRRNDKSSANLDANQYAVGYTYALSKRTNLYSAYARIKNTNNAGFTVGDATSAGSGDKALNVGVRHTF